MESPETRISDELIVKVAAMAMLTVGLIRLPEAAGSPSSVLVFLFSKTSASGFDEFDSILSRIEYQQVAMLLGDAVSVALLFFLARWMFTHPPLVRRALARVPASREATDPTSTDH